MTPRQIDLVQSSFRNVLLVSDTTAELFYARLFALEPSLKSLFTGGMKQQRKMFMYSLGAAVAWLKSFQSVVPSLEALAQRHVGYGITPAHYDAFGDALLWALERGLGEGFDDETSLAWRSVYQQLAAIMKEAAYRPQSSPGGQGLDQRPAND